MGTLLGNFGIADGDYVFTATIGQGVIWDETKRLFQRYNRDVEDMMKTFVQSTTWNHTERYRMGGISKMDKGDFWGQSPPAATKPAGYYQVAYPLYQVQNAKIWNDVERRYLTMEEYENFLQDTINANNDQLMLDILVPIFQNAPAAFEDPNFGPLTLVPLANGDATVYPPVLGTYTESTENMYLAPGFTEAQISYTNDPFHLVRQKLQAHWGYLAGGTPITAYVSTTASQYVELHPDFVQYPWRDQDLGDDVSKAVAMASGIRSARPLGTIKGVKVIEWARIPTGYILATSDLAKKPLKRRIDPPGTGLKGGLEVIPGSKHDGPLTSGLMFRRREGYAVASRLGACVVDITGATTYSPPTEYASR